MGKRCICIALVLILVTTIGLAPLAQPAEAVAGVVVAGAVVAVMAMAGITIVTSGMTAAQIQDWVEDKLEEWSADVGSPLDHLINSAGIGVTISGLLTIGTAAAQGISDFITWLKADIGLSDNTTTQIEASEQTINGYRCYKFNTATMTRKYWNGSISVIANSDVYAIPFDDPSLNGKQFLLVSTSSFTGVVKYTNGNQIDTFRVQHGANYVCIDCINGFAFNNIISINPNFAFPEMTTPYYDLMNNAITYVPGSSLALDSGVITVPQVQNDDKVFVDVGALPGSTIQEVTEGVISDVAADTLDVSGTVAEEEPEYVITGPVSVSGLDDIFPFCIPFDLYHMLEALAADPVAPYFEWRFYVPRIIDYTIVIDLSGFNTVAQILRVMETLLFCVGLAFETRKLIRS